MDPITMVMLLCVGVGLVQEATWGGLKRNPSGTAAVDDHAANHTAGHTSHGPMDGHGTVGGHAAAEHEDLVIASKWLPQAVLNWTPQVLLTPAITRRLTALAKAGHQHSAWVIAVVFVSGITQWGISALVAKHVLAADIAPQEVTDPANATVTNPADTAAADPANITVTTLAAGSSAETNVFGVLMALFITGLMFGLALSGAMKNRSGRATPSTNPQLKCIFVPAAGSADTAAAPGMNGCAESFESYNVFTPQVSQVSVDEFIPEDSYDFFTQQISAVDEAIPEETIPEIAAATDDEARFYANS